MPKTGIHLFRTSLRLHDNPALFACFDEVEKFIPIFIFDKTTTGLDICGFNRFRFLIQSLKDLENQFKNYAINLMCFYGETNEILKKLIDEWNVNVISLEKNSDSRCNRIDNLIRDLCISKNIQLIELISHTLYDPEEIFSLNNGASPNTCEQLKKFCSRIGEPPKVIQKPDFQFIASNLIKTNDLYEPKLHRVPDLDYFNLKPECQEQEICIYEGGEQVALKLWKQRLESEKELFKQGIIHTNSKLVLFKNEISLSPYLRFGCLSVRKFYWDLKKAYIKYFNGNKNLFNPTEQLYWREYFYHLSYKNDYYFQVDQNKMCFKIPWDTYKKDDLFLKWEQGKTGFPWIDACIRQLRQEGWIHHVCRNSIAIFLTRGDLYLSWEKGLQTFLYYLIDADWPICSGNWNWISCGDPEEIISDTIDFCPVKHSKRLDPNGIYIRKYVKEIQNFSNEYIFEPWKAPINVQEEANCIIGKDYPEPIVEHEKVFKENITKLRQFFQTEKKELFDEFINNQTILKPANSNEYKMYTFSRFLETEFSDF